MNRTFLEAQGLGKEAIDSVMAEYGKSMQTLKDELAVKKQEVDALTADKEELAKQVEQVESLEAKLKETADVTKRTLIESSGAKDTDIVMMYLKDAADLDEFKEKLTGMKTDKEFLFESKVEETPEPKDDNARYKVVDNKLPKGEPVTMTKDKIMKISDMAERQKAINDNKDLFK